jgi:UTP-glucose-1-phosphate uridylyltransferase
MKINDLHIHKRFLDKARRGKYVKIYFSPEKELEFDKRLLEEEKHSIISEIKNVLKKNPTLLKEFAAYVVDQLTRWTSGDITIEDAQRFAKHIATIFDLKPEITQEFVAKVKDRLTRYISQHDDELGKVYIIEQSKKKISIGPGKGYLQKRYINAEAKEA